MCPMSDLWLDGLNDRIKNKAPLKVKSQSSMKKFCVQYSVLSLGIKTKFTLI